MGPQHYTTRSGISILPDGQPSDHFRRILRKPIGYSKDTVVSSLIEIKRTLQTAYHIFHKGIHPDGDAAALIDIIQGTGPSADGDVTGRRLAHTSLIADRCPFADGHILCFRRIAPCTICYASPRTGRGVCC